MRLPVVLFAIALVAAVTALYWLWWRLPKRYAARDVARRTAQGKREDYYRLQASKALGGLLALGVFFVTVEQTVSVQVAAVNARVRTNQLTAYDHYQKALEALTKVGHTEVLHVGAIYSLGTMANESPELAVTVANELALTAVTYPTGASEVRTAVGPGGAGPGSRPDENAISKEAQVALSVLGTLSVMQAGLPLQLAGGKFHGANLPGALLNGVQLPGTDVSGGDLYKAQLYNANFRGSVLSGANLTGARLTNAGFYGSVLCEGANSLVSILNTGEPVGVQMSGALLDGADFERAWLIGAFMSSSEHAQAIDKTNLRFANFRDASLKGADFRYSLLDHADFSGADLTGAKLTGAAHEGVVTSETTRFCRTTMYDGTNTSKCSAWDVPPEPDATGKPHGPEKGRDCVKGKTWQELDEVLRKSWASGPK